MEYWKTHKQKMEELQKYPDFFLEIKNYSDQMQKITLHAGGVLTTITDPISNTLLTEIVSKHYELTKE